jgi:hypothetical protein
MTHEYAVTALRSAALRTRLLTNEIDTIGLALRDKLISPEAALLWARDIGALELVGADDADFDAMDAIEAVP